MSNMFFARAVKKAGTRTAVTRQNGSSEQCFAVISPMLYKNRRYITPYVSPVGGIDENRYLFMSAATSFAPPDRCKTEGAEYKFLTSEVVSVSGKPLYTWGVLEKISGGDGL